MFIKVMDEPCNSVYLHATRGQYTSTSALKPRDCTCQEKIPTLCWLTLFAYLFHMVEINRIFHCVDVQILWLLFLIMKKLATYV